MTETKISKSKERIGLLCVVLSSIFFSIGGLFIKRVPWAPLAISGGRAGISVIVLGLFVLITKKKLKFTLPIAVGAISIAATTTLFVFANKLTTAANAIVLQFTAPVFIILFMWLLFREKPNKLDVITCIAVFSGITCFFIDSLSAGGMLGNIFAILSGVSYAGVFMMNASKNGDPFSSVFFGHLLTAIIGMPWIFAETNFTPDALISISVLGVFDMALAYLLLSIGVQYVRPVTASLVSGLEPILSPIIVAVFDGEMISAVAFVGAVIVLVSIIVYNCINAKKTT